MHSPLARLEDVPQDLLSCRASITTWWQPDDQVMKPCSRDFHGVWKSADRLKRQYNADVWRRFSNTEFGDAWSLWCSRTI